MYKKFFVIILIISLIFIIFAFDIEKKKKNRLILATTTSVVDSGLCEVLIPEFEKKYNCIIHIIAVGSGHAVRLGKEGNADILLLHDEEEEKNFVTTGYGILRTEIMFNDFIIVGPHSDPAEIRYEKNVDTAFKKILESNSLFISRGDNSGTYKKELSIWKTVSSRLNPEVLSRYNWYLDTGSGMAQTLRIADEKGGYCLVDRATWIAQRKKCKNLTILFSDTEKLYNPYSLIIVSPEKFSHTNFKLAKDFLDFVMSNKGQQIIKSFGVKEFGEPLYYSKL